MKTDFSRRLPYLAMTLAFSLVLGFVESFIPLPVGIPGVKLGLANLCVLLLLYTEKKRTALAVLLLRILLSSLLFGTVVSLLYSLCGGLLAFLGMSVVRSFSCFSPVGCSMLGGVLHNAGQMGVAVLLFRNVRLLAYLPVLFFCGMATGIAVGALAVLITPKLTKILPSCH